LKNDVPSLTAELAGFASGLTLASLSPSELEAAKRHTLDSLGACVAGAGEPMVEKAIALLRSLGNTGDVPLLGTRERFDLLSAVYLMAVSAHALELDDGNREGSIHPGTVVIPAVLGTGYRLGSDGASALAAVVAGYEVAISLAEVLHPHASKRGFQTTGVVGVVGAAAATARLLGLDAAKTEKALGIAASSGAGLFAYLIGGGNVKKLHPGHAAREGVLAAFLARDEVVEGPRAVAETSCGIFQAFGGVTAPAGGRTRRSPLAIARSYLKPYPCCRHIHPAIDALFELKERHRIDPDQVAAIEVGTYGAAMPHATLGWDSFTVAQLSFPYVMAAALRSGTIELDTFSKARRADPLLAADAAKVKVFLDDECAASYPKQGPARVTVKLRDGSTHTLYVADPQGAPQVPMSNDALFRKFRMMLGGRPADALIKRVWEIEREPSVKSLMENL
jgi:2-methylcitrate dehydratase PrpD